MILHAVNDMQHEWSYMQGMIHNRMILHAVNDTQHEWSYMQWMIRHMNDLFFFLISSAKLEIMYLGQPDYIYIEAAFA